MTSIKIDAQTIARLCIPSSPDGAEHGTVKESERLSWGDYECQANGAGGRENGSILRGAVKPV